MQLTSESDMRTFIFILLSFFAGIGMKAQVTAEVSETVELMSILSRTAGFREYCMDMGGKYTKDTETWFAPYKQHAIIPYYQDLRAKYGISYDAVMSMALHLAIDKGKLVMLADKAHLEKRWNSVDVDAFLILLNQFYTETRFHEFYQQHLAFYDEVLKTYEANVMPHFNQDWYMRFYGCEPTEQFRVIIGFTNGGGSYGPSRELPGHPKESFAICGYWINEQSGKAFEDGASMASTLIHEFNHSFVNPLLKSETNTALMESIGKELQELSYIGMKNQAYGNWQTVVNESIVRAAVIIYMQEHGFEEKQLLNEMYNQVSRDFRWMPELVVCLRNYTNHRDQYKTLSDYYPEIAKCLDKYINEEKERMRSSLHAEL